MKVNIKVQYTEKEIEALIMKEHVSAFGNPPPGMVWEISRNYRGDYDIESVDEPTAPVEKAQQVPGPPPETI